MHTVRVKCPHCKSEYDVAAEKDSVFCMECGTTITVAEQSKTEYTYTHNENINKNVNVDDKRTYRKVDDARIREADVQESIRLRELEIELIKLQDSSRQKKFAIYTKLVVVVVLLLITALPILLMMNAKDGGSELMYLMFAIAMATVSAIVLPRIFRS